ncbi:MAG: protein translocase subunit SecD [Candidatus Omnitrophica bacterium]|nr:protein translocase subunit SecD [Candidatus Omnitrophota bacterium]
MMRNHYIKTGFIIAIVAFCIWQIYPPEKKIKKGLDLQGGVHIVLEVQQPPEGDKSMSDVTQRALEIIRNRVDGLGVSEPVIQREGVNRIIVDLPGIKDTQRAIDIIGKTALLEFRLVEEDPKKLSDALKGDSEVLKDYEVLYMHQKDERGIVRETNPILVKRVPELTGAGLSDAFVGYGPSGFPEVNFVLNKEGAAKFAAVTGENIGRRLAIVLDGVVKSAPVIRDRIPDGRGQISGDFKMEEARELAIILRAGALPAEVKIIYQQVVGPTLGKEYIEKSLRASLFGVIIVVLFMIVYYYAFGFLADLAMGINLLLLLAFMSMFKGVLTLPGIAGIALTCGMAVDANILIFERIREELRQGKSAKAAIDAGYHRAWSAILDSNITTIITGAILFFLGEGPIKGFGLTLSVGIIANLFTAVFATKAIVDFIIANKSIEKLRI